MTQLRYNKQFLWGDKWSIEDDKGWFVAGNVNILFKINMLTNRYQAVTALPGNFQSDFRLNSSCIKYENSIFCMPDYGYCIWCYELSSASFQKIEIINPRHVKTGIGDFWRCGNFLWAVAGGLKQIIEIDLKKKIVIGYYDITSHAEEKIAKSTKSGNYIYTVSASKSRIYEFNIETKKIKTHELPEIDDGLRTISIYNGTFWLSGYKKKIYIWNKEKNKIKILNCFPTDFGIYDFENTTKKILDCETIKYHTFTFLESILVGEHIWFIPFQTNQILYLNINTNQINVFEMEDEDEDVESLRNRQMNCKYILQYVCEEQYLGLYSLKHDMIFEIDTKNLKMKKLFITFDDNYSKNIFSNWVLKESISGERFLYMTLIEKRMKIKNKEKNIGKKIYNCVR